MVTIHQLSKGARKPKKFSSSTPAFYGCPQKRGVCEKVYIVKPKKPNSAQRKVAKVRLVNGRKLLPIYR